MKSNPRILTVFLILFAVGTTAAQSINMASIQITLRTHHQYYKAGQADQDTWSWTPRISYRVNGPITSRSQLAVDFTLPSGKQWIHFDCNTGETKEKYWWQTECGANSSDVKDQDATIETGLAGLKISIKNELQGTNSTLFAGKFKVDKFNTEVIDLPKFKNHNAYFVNEDWALPIGYVYGSDPLDLRVGNRPSQTEERLTFVTWFKGDDKRLDFDKYVAYLFYQGKQVADSAGGDKYGSTGCEVTNSGGGYDSPNNYCRRQFRLNAMVWDKQPEFHPMDFKLYANPGEYEIKILQNGKLARTAKFTLGTNNAIVDTGIGP